MKVKKEKNKIILLSVGGLYKLKGHHYIIKALKKVRDQGYDAELLIVGKGYFKSALIELVQRLQLQGHVTFLGSKGHEELVQLYNTADIFVLANEQEVTPAVNEALACEVPVVVMECGGCDYVIPDDRVGLRAKKRDSDDLAEKIKFIKDNPGRAKQMARRGRQMIVRKFSIETVARKIYGAMTHP